MTTVGQASLYPYLFAGMDLDSSGLYHTQSRYYSPTFGRFLSADAGMPPNPFSYVGNDSVNAIDPSGMTAEFVSGATGMSPPPDGARGVADAQPESGGLGGAVLAQGCEPIPCAPLPIQSSPESGSWLADLVSFFVGLFGGGGSQPAFIPRGYRRVAHYPAMSFITDSQADIQQFTPDLKQKSTTLEVLKYVALGAAVVGIAAAIVFQPEVGIPLAADLLEEGAPELAGSVGEGASLTGATSEYTLTETVAKNLASRPYLNSRLLVQEIESTGLGVPDPGGIPGALRYDVPGTLSTITTKGISKGIYELVIHPDTNIIYHFLFTSGGL
ncbi:MAG: RHS repeat-associated core domain-containing protein [Candidatus Binataceae bacterium]|nr:RHS repeat-associated core domain-containing protein [Candidatus Binataceae bacterium]